MVDIRTGVHLTHDRLYLGRITKAAGGDDTTPRPRKVAGQVAIGWAGEPAFIGAFTLRPRFD